MIELADGVLQTGPTYFERDREQAIAVPWTPPESWDAGERASPSRSRRRAGEPTRAQLVPARGSRERPTPYISRPPRRNEPL